ncbi:glutamate racemase [Olsenella sp. Marseille-P4559]|uniref:glutamate racemase n=1 Tax=Olsenella sp. Marseille-P4559 TaxID=2364795 RepID=UPI0010307625|nr:glutamate racemase [Olsenella sp. Marseille-P4559]
MGAERDGFIGAFDSGVGGLTILSRLVAELPHERFVFFGDSAHAPYGDKPPEEILALSRRTAASLVDEGAKALVIACNTATSVAAPTLREVYPGIPIIGVEPALKPATLAPRHRRILVMATAATLRLGKFQRLEDRWGTDSEVIEVPCVGLADLIEKGDPGSPQIRGLLERYLGPWRGKVDSVVLGCTHYPLVRDQILEVMGDVALFDGGEGTARETRRRLGAAGLLAPDSQAGSVELRSSIDTPGELALYRRLFDLARGSEP